MPFYTNLTALVLGMHSNASHTKETMYTPLPTGDFMNMILCLYFSLIVTQNNAKISLRKAPCFPIGLPEDWWRLILCVSQMNHQGKKMNFLFHLKASILVFRWYETLIFLTVASLLKVYRIMFEQGVFQSIHSFSLCEKEKEACFPKYEIMFILSVLVFWYGRSPYSFKNRHFPASS